MLSIADVATTVGVIGGGIWATWSSIAQANIRNAILSLKVELITELSDLSQAQAVQSNEIQNLERRVEKLEDLPPNAARSSGSV